MWFLSVSKYALPSPHPSSSCDAGLCWNSRGMRPSEVGAVGAGTVVRLPLTFSEGGSSASWQRLTAGKAVESETAVKGELLYGPRAVMVWSRMLHLSPWSAARLAACFLTSWWEQLSLAAALIHWPGICWWWMGPFWDSLRIWAKRRCSFLLEKDKRCVVFCEEPGNVPWAAHPPPQSRNSRVGGKLLWEERKWWRRDTF